MPTISSPGVGTVEYFEAVPGSPVISLSPGACRVERTFIIAWEDIDIFTKLVIGYPKIVETNYDKPHDTYISRVLPQGFPLVTKVVNGTDNSDDTPVWLYASGITRIDGAGPTGQVDENGIALYERARVQVVYEAMTHRMLEDAEMPKATSVEIGGSPIATGDHAVVDESSFGRYVTKMQRPSAEYVTLPRGFYAWVNPTKQKVDYANAQILPWSELTWTWHQVPFLPEAVLKKNRVGTVNKTAFAVRLLDGSSVTYAAGTLLLLSTELRPYRMPSGAFVHDIIYRIKYFEPETGKGHNYFLHYAPGSSTLVRIKITDSGKCDELDQPAAINKEGDTIFAAIPASTGKSIYPYTEFKELFVRNIP